MSTSCECWHVEVEPGRWYYILENPQGSPNAWDWREDATAYGPFESLDASRKSQIGNHPNPGGFSVFTHDDRPPMDDTVTRLIENAWRPDPHGGLWSPDGDAYREGPFMVVDWGTP